MKIDFPPPPPPKKKKKKKKKIIIKNKGKFDNALSETAQGNGNDVWNSDKTSVYKKKRRLNVS